MKRLLAIILLLSGYALAQCPDQTAAIVSAGNGNWSSTTPNAPWPSGTVPVNKFVVINNHHVTIDTDVQSCTIILQGTSVNLDSDGSAHTLTFYSTGNNSKGTGNIDWRPSSDATSMGFIVAQGGGATNGLHLNNVSITTQDNTSPWYAYRTNVQAIGYTGAIVGTTFTTTGQNTTTGTTISIKGGTLSHIGSSSMSIRNQFKNTFTPAAIIDIENNHIIDAKKIDNEGGLAQTGTFIVKNNWIEAPTFAANSGFINIPNGNPLPDNAVIEQNVLSGLVNKGYLYLGLNTSSPTGLSFKENAAFSDGAESGLITFGGSSTGVGTGNTVQYNYNYDPIGVVMVPIIGGTSPMDKTTLINRNVLWGGWESIGMYAYGAASGDNVVTISENWMHTLAIAYLTGGQGGPITYNTSTTLGTFIIQKNVMQNECGTGIHPSLGALYYSVNGTSYNTVLQDHEAVYASCASSFDIGFEYGEGTTNGGIVSSSGHSNIIYGNAYQYQNGNTSGLSSFTGAPQYASAGIHHNLCFKFTSCYTNGASKGVGWDDGVNFHPNAVYGDISTQNPNILNIDAKPEDFDKAHGGAGTITSFKTMMQKRWCGVGCGFDPNYTIQNVWTNLMSYFQPQNTAIVGQGYNGTDIGPFPVRVRKRQNPM